MRHDQRLFLSLNPGPIDGPIGPRTEPRTQCQRFHRPIGSLPSHADTVAVGLELIIDTFISDIESGEFTVAALIGDDHRCDWAYTVGLDRCLGHPELVIVGLEADFGGALLELLGNQVADGLQIRPGDEVEVIDGLVLRARTVDPIWRSMGEWFTLGQTVMAWWGLRWPETLQLLWPDGNGQYPTTSGDPRWILEQPMLSIAC